MKNIYKLAVLVLTVVIVISFFLPWVSVKSPLAGKVNKLLGGKEQSPMMTISGYDIPVLANSDESKLMITVIKIFNPGVTGADKKSYLIWIIPLLAIVMLVLKWFLDRNLWVNLGIGVVGILIFAVAVYKITTTDLDKTVLKVTIDPGLWLILFSYLGIGVITITNFAQNLIAGKK